jgi:DUF1680 family protein
MDPEPRSERQTAVVAPVIPSDTARVRLRPIGLLGSRISGGMWAARRATNHQVSLPHAAAQLERVGNLTNLRLAAGEASGTYQGGNDDFGTTAPFLDSDVYKWLEAIGWELAQEPDPALRGLADPVVDLVGRAQRQDGYLDTFYQVRHPGAEFTDLEWGHELYVAGHMAQAAVAWHRGLGDDRLLRVVERFVERIWQELGPGRRELICGHPELEMALVELFRATGEARYLELARLLVERRGHGLLARGRFGDRYWQDHEPVRSAHEPTGHAVRQMYLDCGVVDVATETGDSELLVAALERWAVLVGTRTYLTGSLGSRHRDEAIGAAFELPPDRAYAETCAAIGSVMLAWRLLLATGEARFADLIERTAMNAVLSGLAADGCHFFYSNPLLRHSSGVEILEGAATTRRAAWFEVSCCPPNLMRFLATFPDLVASVDADGLQVHQYATGSIHASVGHDPVGLAVMTDYPWDGHIAIDITASPARPWTLAVRIPDWCPRATLTLDGATPLAESAPGYVALTRTWRPGEHVVLHLPMEPHVTTPHPRIDALRATVALERGPLVYAIEDADLPDGASIESIEVDDDLDVRAVTGGVPGDPGGTRLEFEATIRDDGQHTGWPYPSRSSASPPTAARPAPTARVQAVPYFAWAQRPGLGMRVWIPTRSGPRGDG